jgi:hypothetical protein
MHNSDPTPQGVENRNILLLFKCVLTALGYEKKPAELQLLKKNMVVIVFRN